MYQKLRSTVTNQRKSAVCTLSCKRESYNLEIMSHVICSSRSQITVQKKCMRLLIMIRRDLKSLVGPCHSSSFDWTLSLSPSLSLNSFWEWPMQNEKKLSPISGWNNGREAYTQRRAQCTSWVGGHLQRKTMVVWENGLWAWGERLSRIFKRESKNSSKTRNFESFYIGCWSWRQRRKKEEGEKEGGRGGREKTRADRHPWHPSDCHQDSGSTPPTKSWWTTISRGRFMAWKLSLTLSQRLISTNVNLGS